MNCSNMHVNPSLQGLQIGCSLLHMQIGIALVGPQPPRPMQPPV
jgi:hypothetical protein